MKKLALIFCICLILAAGLFAVHAKAEAETAAEAEDPALMLNSSGCLSKERAMAEGRPAVALEPVFGRRTPSFFARPAYRRKDGEKGAD